MKKTFIASFIACSLFFAGCTAAATKTALDTQKRVNTIQETVYSNQAKSLKVLLYKNLVVQLERDGQAEQPDFYRVKPSNYQKQSIHVQASFRRSNDYFKSN
jgi:hypothetical protein